MITPRKLAFAALGLFILTLFFLRRSPSPPSLVRQRKEDTVPSSSTGKSKEEIDRILEQESRPLRQVDEFDSLRDHLAYAFPYAGPSATKFPAYIWQTWKYTPAQGEFDEKFRVTEASWTEKHPDYVHEVITDDVAEVLIAHLYSSIPSVVEAYNDMPVPILKADFFRYLILFARGGIYADIDTEALRPAHFWLPETSPANTVGLIVGIEADPNRDDWRDWYSRRVQFCQWVMRAKVGHPVLREVIARIVEETLRRKEEGKLNDKDRGGYILEWTGPGIWTDTIYWGMNSQTKTGKGTKPGADVEEWSWVQFTGITEAKVCFF
jgi:alpha 1,6-mannosyltransferase